MGRLLLLLACSRGREGSRVVGDNGHFGAVEAFLVENPVFKFDRQVRIFVIAQIVLAGIVFGLGSRTVDCLDEAPPFLFA
jgi:hypothetical protein